MTILPAIEINPKTAPQGTVIWLHGLGASGHDFAAVTPELGLPATLALRFIFPHAPDRAVTINQGYRMPAWFDITGFDASAREDEAGLIASEAQIHALIQREIDRGVTADQIILAGFSQGGATALFTGLRSTQTLKGIMVLSGYCPARHTLDKTRQDANAHTPIWIGHGTQDDVVPHQWADLTVKALRAWHYSVSWHDYPMAHSVCQQELRDIGAWISKLYLTCKTA